MKNKYLWTGELKLLSFLSCLFLRLKIHTQCVKGVKENNLQFTTSLCHVDRPRAFVSTRSDATILVPRSVLCDCFVSRLPSVLLLVSFYILFFLSLFNLPATLRTTNDNRRLAVLVRRTILLRIPQSFLRIPRALSLRHPRDKRPGAAGPEPFRLRAAVETWAAGTGQAAFNRISILYGTDCDRGRREGANPFCGGLSI